MGEFFEKVKRGGVFGPRRQEFTLANWKAASEKYGLQDRTEEFLYGAGLLMHSKFGAIRKALKQSSLSRLSTETRVKALLAAVNHQLGTLELQVKTIEMKNLDSGPRERDILDLANTQVKLVDGQQWTIDVVLSNLLDGVLLPLSAALKRPYVQANDSFADVQWNHVRDEINLGILYGQAEGLWEDCLWNTYVVAMVNSKVLAMPTDLDVKIGLVAASARKLSLGVEAMFRAKELLRLEQAGGHAPRILEVKDITNKDSRQRIELDSHELDMDSRALLLAVRLLACPPYYDNLVFEPQELLQGLTLSQLFDGWMVASRAARVLYEKTAQAYQSEEVADLDAPSDMREFVPFFTRDALVTALHQAAGLTVSQAEVVIEFLTFRAAKGQVLWAQPLVCAGDLQKLYPVFGALATPPSPRFILETWMAQLKIKLERRGPAFEEYLRCSLVEAAAESPTLGAISKVVAVDWTFHCAGGSGQVDALFCIGSQVFVLEAKCILEPVDANSIGTLRAAIEYAVQQARHRVTLIENHRSHFTKEMKQFGWDLPDNFKVHPLVAVSTVAHVGLPFEDVAVVDEHVLRGFFQGGYDVVGLDQEMSIVDETRHAYYSDAVEAQACAAEYFAHPPQLQKYADALQPRLVPVYAVAEGDWQGEIVDLEQG
ncbi:hypothetical protein [Variovorax boronicumulans]